RKFLSHQLWSGDEDLNCAIIKYKMKQADDTHFLDPLKRGHKVRLDANGLFTREKFHQFLKSIPDKLMPQIEYIQDPLLETNWNDLNIKSAKKLIQGSPYDVFIHRPNSQFYPENEQNVIFTSFMGSELGAYHGYCEVIEKGDLTKVHGLIVRGYFKEEISLFDG